jgi:hypothetical protein
MLRAGLDLDHWRRAFAETGKIRITDAFDRADAEAIAAEMAHLPYKVFCATKQGVAVLDPAEVARWPKARQDELTQFLMTGAAEGEGFVYDGMRLSEAWADGQPSSALGRLHAWLESDEARNVVAHITGGATDGTFVQATRYRPGHYLTRHLDDPKGESRRYAFVIGMTKMWRPDWGGLLQFFSEDGLSGAEALIPGFNCIDLFDVKHWHSVTYVAPFAQAPRLALSGWFTRGQARPV